MKKLDLKSEKIWVVIFWVSFFEVLILADLYKIQSVLLDILFVIGIVAWNVSHIAIMVIRFKKKRKR